MEEGLIQKDEKYQKAKKEQKEGMNHLKTSCIKCKYTPNYQNAISNLNTATDIYSTFSITKPELYKLSIVLDEIKCREKLISCLEKEYLLNEAGEQGIKLAKLYISYCKNYHLAYKTMENFT